MKTHKIIAAAVCSTLFCSAQLFGQGITTIICSQALQTNQVQITASQTVQIKSYWDSEGTAPGFSSVIIQSGVNPPITISAASLISKSYAPNLTIAGPATISLVTGDYGGVQVAAILTLDVEPGPYPPGKTAVVGSNSGNVQVTMEISTDLVN